MKGKFLKGLLAILLLLCSYNARAYDFTAVNDDGATLYYSITSKSDLTCEVARNSSINWENGLAYTSYVIDIPSEVTYNNTTYKVTSIGKCAFQYATNIQVVVIPESVTFIADGAFQQCTNLTTITIPESVTTIEGYAFYNCKSLTSITFPSSITSIGESTFYNCTRLQSFNMPDEVTSIGRSAFYQCTNLKSINMPDGVTSIGQNAFYECTSLSSITIPENVTSIGVYAFYRCTGLKEVTFNSIACNSENTSSSGVFDNCTYITQAKFGDRVTNIPMHLFKSCTRITEITIPNSVLTIEEYAFDSCTKLTSLTLGNSVTNIGSYAFWSCSSLSEITSLNPEPPTCGSYCFYDVSTSSCKLYVPEGSIDAYKVANTWKDFYNIETGITDIIADPQAEELYRYSIDGSRINTPKKGINIIKYSDGTTRKVLVK